MDADDLQNGFRVGEWLVEPRAARITGKDRSVALPPAQLAILVCLAELHGEAVDHRTLCARAWPRDEPAGNRLREEIHSLQHALGDSLDEPRYIVPVANRGYALIAHVEPLVADPVLAPAGAGAPASTRSTVAGRAQALLVELRRRHVFKVVGAYLLGTWILLQVAETTFEPLHLPGWWMTALTIVTVVGLPVVVALAWTYEITPDGIVLDDANASNVRLPKARRALAPLAVVGVSVMALITGIAWWQSIDIEDEPSAAPAPDGAPSIAVLPLTDLSASGREAYLGDGLSEELSTRLAQIPGLRVAARTSAFEYKGRNLDVRQIGTALGVRHVLEGSVRRDGDAVRVTVQLIDAVTGYHLWAGSYDREWRNVLVVQDDIAQSVAGALRVVLAPSERVGRKSSPAGAETLAETIDVRALDPYLSGLALLRQPADRSRLRDAERLFGEAIAAAPQFAGAHAGLCRVRVREFEQSRDPAALAAGEGACRRALELDPTLIDTEKALARLQLAAGDYVQAQARYRELIARNPADADPHIGLGDALAGSGSDEPAESAYRRAAEVEPAFWQAHNALGVYLFQRGRNAEAEVCFGKTVTLAPSSALAWSNLGGARQMQGDFEGALAAYRKSLELEPSRIAYSNLATTQFYLGRFDEAVVNLRRSLELGAHDHLTWGNLGDTLWQIDGRRDEAVRAYRKAIELAESERARTAGDPALLAQLGYYYSRAGDAAKSTTYLDAAAADGPTLVYVQYFLARAASDRGDVDNALAAVGRLVSLGYPVALLRSAPEFGELVNDDRFKKLLDRDHRA